MARREEHPFSPRISAPDLPRELAPGNGLQRGAEHFQQEVTAWEVTTDASHAGISECRLTAASVDSLTLTGASLVDVEIDQLRATTVSARGARLRRVRFTGGRIGTLDLGVADVDEVELRGLEMLSLTDAAALRGATLSAVQVERLAPAFAAALGIRVKD